MARLPALKPSELIRALERAGFFLDHSSGSHRFYRHATRRGLVTVPFHRKDLKRGTLQSILDQAGLTREDLLKLL
jgi:predicted RNA binding protein YcfA (HicA-like mRNA interferase family)